MNKKYALICLEKLTGWLKRKGYKIDFSHNNEDQIVFEDKIIYISTRTNYECRVYSLLHECGHLIEYNGGHSKYFKRYPTAKRIMSDARSQYSKEGIVETLEEEINAWRQGMKLYKRLGLNISDQKYNAYAAKYLLQYIDWAAQRGRNRLIFQWKKDLDKPWEI